MEMESPTVFPEVASASAVSFSGLKALLDFVDQGLLLSELDGRIVIANLKGRECLASLGHADFRETNLLGDLLKTSPDALLEKTEGGSREVQLEIVSESSKFLATVQRVPEQDWLLLQFERVAGNPSTDAALSSQCKSYCRNARLLTEI